MTNPHKNAAQMQKAITMAFYLEKQFPALVADDAADDFTSLSAMPADWWASIAKEAGVRAPSTETIERTINILRGSQVPKMTTEEFIASLKGGDGREFFASCSAVQA